MNVFWASPVIEWPRANFFAAEAIVVLQTQQSDPYKASWTITDANRASPWAVGAAVLTDAQVALLEAQSRVHIVREVSWTSTFSQLPAQIRNRINQFCDDIGVPRPNSNEVLRDLYNRLVAVIEPVKSIESIFAEAQAR